MGFTINLSVKPELLKKHAYGQQYGYEQLDSMIKAKQLAHVTYIDDLTEDALQANHILKEFNTITKAHKIEIHHDDLLYFILCLNESYKALLENIIQPWADDTPQSLNRKANEIAKLVLMYKDNPDFTKVGIQFSIPTTNGNSKRQKLILTSQELLTGIHSAILEAIKSNTPPFNDTTRSLSFLSKDSDGLPSYKSARDIAQKHISAISIHQRRIWTEFMIQLNNFVIEEGIFVVQEGTQHSNKLLRFLYDVSVLFGWIPESKVGPIEAPDYIRTTFLNYRKQYCR